MGVDLEEAISRIKSGEVVAYPTETFYALGVSPSNEKAVKALLELKGRAALEGVPLIAYSKKIVNSLFFDSSELIKKKREELQNVFWPGPLTIVSKIKEDKKDKIHPLIYGPAETLAIRVSSLELSRTLALKATPLGLITSTSANPKGFPPPKTKEEVKNYFPTIYTLPTEFTPSITSPSTIITTTTTPFTLLRKGPLPIENYL